MRVCEQVTAAVATEPTAVCAQLQYRMSNDRAASHHNCDQHALNSDSQSMTERRREGPRVDSRQHDVQTSTSSMSKARSFYAKLDCVAVFWTAVCVGCWVRARDVVSRVNRWSDSRLETLKTRQDTVRLHVTVTSHNVTTPFQHCNYQSTANNIT